MKYTLIEVNDKKSAREFILFPVRLYKNDPNYIRPLDVDVEKVFDPKQNKLFRQGECIRWILKDEQGNTVGRVAAFVDHKSAVKNEQPTGGMGFFDCIDDEEAAFTLFDACKKWLEARGMEAMDGPINFGERDRWWGCLIEGFTPPNYCNNYNFPYYRRLFEAYGFQDYFRQITYHVPIDDSRLNPVIREKARRISANPHYRFEHIRKGNDDKYVKDFLSIYNRAWAKFPGVKPLNELQVKAMFKAIKPIMDERLIWFGYYDDDPIACFLMIPEINAIVRHLNGNFNLWGKIKFMYYKWRGVCKKSFGFVFGVVPEYQRKGVEGALIMAYAAEALKPDFPYTDLELNWIGDFNPAMMHLVEEVGCTPAKIHITYRYLFDRTKEFKRCPRVS
jgi:GNAT superfamily N-acetyltransferase